MSGPKSRVVAITLNWNSESDVVACVRSLLESSLIPDVVIIDNGSRDGSADRLAEQFRTNGRVRVIRNQTNEGFARAVNRGMKLAIEEATEYVFLINNDAIVDRTCIEKLVHALEEEKTACAATPVVLYRKHVDRVWQGAGYFNYLRANVAIPEKNQPFREQTLEAVPVTFVSGCALLIRTQELVDHGLFDTDLFFYGEDVEFSLRAARHGARLLFIPNAKAWHNIDDIAKTRTSAYVFYHRARSSLLVLRKSFHWPYFLYAVILHIILYTPFRIYQGLRGETPLRSIAGWMKGTMHGLFSPTKVWIG